MKKYIILIPVFNDWISVFKLIDNIDLQISDQSVDIIIVNDASTENFETSRKQFNKINSVKILNLKENGGHRKAIATGLKYCEQNLSYDFIIPMDGDGEDRPEELKNFFLASEKQDANVITGIRVKRSEGLLFKSLYFIHKCITKFITGKDIRFGNFTCLSKQAVTTLLSDGSIWLSFSGAVTKHFSSHDTINSYRGSRYFGPSKMSLFKLILHSQRISAVFKEVVFVRIVALILILGLLAYYISAYLLILALSGWVFLFFIVYLAIDNDINKLNNSLKNIKDLTNIYSR